MIETYKNFKRYANGEYIEKSNEDLVELYKEAGNEYLKSQAFSALFIKNFAMLLKISNKCDFIESPEKAGMISEELLKCISGYTGETKFVTYLTTRVSNLFFWEYGKRKKELNALKNSVSLNEDVETSKNDSMQIQVEDEDATRRFQKNNFLMSIEMMFDREMSLHNSQSKADVSYRENLDLARKMINIILEDDKLVNNQIARMMGLFQQKNGNFIYINKPNAPDYIREVKTIDGKTVVTVKEQSMVKAGDWSKIDRLKKFVKELFLRYDILNVSSKIS